MRKNFGQTKCHETQGSRSSKWDNLNLRHLEKQKRVYGNHDDDVEVKVPGIKVLSKPAA